MALLKFRKGTGFDPNTLYLNEKENTYELSVGNKKVKEPISIEEVGQSIFDFSTEDLYIIEVNISGSNQSDSTTQIIKSGQELIDGVTVGGVGTFNTIGSPEISMNLFQYSFMVKLQPDPGVQGEYNVSYSNEEKNIIIGHEDSGLNVINIGKKLFKLS